jgi:hypothetical protein
MMLADLADLFTGLYLLALFLGSLVVVGLARAGR